MTPEKTPPTTGLNDEQRRAKAKASKRRWKESADGRAWWRNYRAAHREEAVASLILHLEQQKPLTDALAAAIRSLETVNDARVGIRPSKANARLASELADAAVALRDLIQGART
jgi:hypothetical protein